MANLTLALAVVLVAQLTPKELGRLQMRKHDRTETRAGSKHTNLDPQFGGTLAFPTMGSRIRDADIKMTDNMAAAINWPHRYGGKVYDDLDPEGRKILAKMQDQWVDDHGYPDPVDAKWRSTHKAPQAKKKAVVRHKRRYRRQPWFW